MTLEELQELAKDPVALAKKAEEAAPSVDTDAVNWEPENHKVFDLSVRPKREVEVEKPKLDEHGNETGEVEVSTKHEEVSRIPSATNKDIVNWAVRMALGIPVTYTANTQTANEETLLKMVQKTISDNKLDYLDQMIEEHRLIYKNVLEVWYTADTDKEYWGELSKISTKKLKVAILSPGFGDTIIPFFDAYKDLLGVIRLYKTPIGDKEVEMMEVYLPTSFIQYRKGEGSSWDALANESTMNGKLQVVLHQADRMITADVQPKLDRREELDSDTAEENLASGRPVLAASGEVKDIGKRANTGQVFQLEQGADMKYVETAGAQEAIEQERKNLLSDIYRETSTPDPSIFEAAGDMPGIAIKLRFTPAINNAIARQQGAIGIGRQRRVNLLKSMLCVINHTIKDAITLEIKPQFGISIPENLVEKYTYIRELYSGGLLSLKTAIRKLGIVEDVDAEIEAIKAERAGGNA